MSLRGLSKGPRHAPACWGEEEPPHEVKAYQPDMPTEYGARRRRGNPTKRKTDASVGTTIVSSAWQSLSLLSIVFETDTPVILGRAMLVPTATFLFLSGSEKREVWSLEWRLNI